jgi:hypothetical protein
VNEDDEKLKTSITKEKDQRSILVIGGIQIFLPSSGGEASIGVADTVMEEKERILKPSPMKEEHPIELFTQWEMELKILEDWLDSLEPRGGCHEIAMPEDTYHHELQLEEDGMEPAKEMAGVSLSEKIVEHQFSDETTKLESTPEASQCHKG